MNNLELTQVEQHILKHSANLEVVQKRRKTAFITGVAFALFVAWVAYVSDSRLLLAAIFIIYIAVTALERVFYANAILTYKRIVQKMLKRIEHLEAKENS